MLKKMKFSLFLLLLFSNLFATSSNEIINSIYYVANKEGVSPRILYTIMKIESDFNPYAISFLTNQANAQYFKSLENYYAKIDISNYSLNRSKWAVSIKPANKEYAKSIARSLYRDGFKIDVGLGQINAVNFSEDEINYIFEPYYNLTKCAKVLRRCFNFHGKSKDLRDTIECYNYGMRKRPSDPYYRKFYKYYMQFFGNS